MPSPNTIAYQAALPRVRPTLLGKYITKENKDNSQVQLVRDPAEKTAVSRDGTAYEVQTSGALKRIGFTRVRGRKPHPRKEAEQAGRQFQAEMDKIDFNKI